MPPTGANPSTSDLPVLETTLDAEQIVQRLDLAARRGRLPGFVSDPGSGLFIVDAWGTPFDHDLIAHADSSPGGTGLSFSLRMRRRLPTIHVVILLLTIWPGVWLTDSMLRLWFSWYYSLTQKDLFIFHGFEWFTYAWYLPLCVFPLPWYWRASLRRSRATARESALEMIGKIARELNCPIPPESAKALERASSPED